MEPYPRGRGGIWFERGTEMKKRKKRINRFSFFRLAKARTEAIGPVESPQRSPLGEIKGKRRRKKREFANCAGQ